MTVFVHELFDNALKSTPSKTALICRKQSVSYLELAQQVSTIASFLQTLTLQRFDRVGIYLHKTIETITSTLACSKTSAVFVPINAHLKASQVNHIINNCEMKVLITNVARLATLSHSLSQLKSLQTILLIDGNEKSTTLDNGIAIINWCDVMACHTPFVNLATQMSSDIAAIFYTSGSTGKAKGVVLSHQNIVLGAQSVAKYLHNSSTDNILAILPLSFDYGFSQVTTSLLSGGCCVLLDYFLPKDVLKAITQYKITGIAAVPPLWSQLLNLEWPEEAKQNIRYFTNSGGGLSRSHIDKLRQLMPNALPYMMYGLTEAFRSTYLPPQDIDCKVGSIGKAIPNAEVLVLRADGSECNPNEPGELVHKGPLVSLGYWNDKNKTQKRFKKISKTPTEISDSEICVWSGDTVKRDEEGYLYFISRADEMIKSSGYRVSPSEIEDVLYQLTNLSAVAILGVSHPELGQAIIAVISTNNYKNQSNIEDDIITHCRKYLPNYMIPKKIFLLPTLPHNANGKIDRSLLHKTYKNYFMESQQ